MEMPCRPGAWLCGAQINSELDFSTSKLTYCTSLTKTSVDTIALR